MKKAIILSCAAGAILLMSFRTSNFFDRILADKGVKSEQELTLNGQDIEKYSGNLNNFMDKVKEYNLSYSINGVPNAPLVGKNLGDIEISVKICPSSGEKCLGILEKGKGSDTIELVLSF
jgi:hypothetical protein